jgi:hypothetical protein
LNTLSSWLRKPSLSYPDRAERRSSPSLAAYHWEGSTPRQNSVGNISSSGALLLTDQPWEPGEIVSLTLQRKGPPVRTPEHRFSLQARAVRRDKDGVGVAFEMPPGADLQLWQSPLKTAEEQTEPEDILGEFRIAAAIAFLRRICPDAAKEIKQLLRERLSNYRLESAVEIALHAEEMLVFAPGARKMRAHPRLVARILEDGSWAANEFIQQCWAGLLATSCAIRKEDETNQVFIELMSQLTAVQARIFASACAMATTFQSDSGNIVAHPLICSAGEIIQIAGLQDLAKIDRDLAHLAELGLLAPRDNTRFFSLLKEADITPTGLGLDLNARCNAHRGTLQDFYGPVSAAASAAD